MPEVEQVWKELYMEVARKEIDSQREAKQRAEEEFSDSTIAEYQEVLEERIEDMKQVIKELEQLDLNLLKAEENHNQARKMYWDTVDRLSYEDEAEIMRAKATYGLFQSAVTKACTERELTKRAMILLAGQIHRLQDGLDKAAAITPSKFTPATAAQDSSGTGAASSTDDGRKGHGYGDATTNGDAPTSRPYD